jgi:hypothetical protein
MGHPHGGVVTMELPQEPRDLLVEVRTPGATAANEVDVADPSLGHHHD